MTEIHEETLVAVIVKGSSLLTVLLACGSLIFASYHVALGIMAGGLIALGNFFWLRSVLTRVLGLLPNKPGIYSFSRFVVRLAVTAIVLYLLIRSQIFAISGLLIGLSVIVMMISFTSIYFAIRKGG